MRAPEPDYERWLRVVEEGLGGRSHASLFWQTLDGFAVPPLTTAADVADLPHRAATALLRQRPRGFAIRQLVTAADPRDANELARRAIERGADEVEFALDAAAQDALEPEAEPVEAVSEAELDVAWPGAGGVAIHARPGLDHALRDIDLGSTFVSFSAGEAALPVLAWWLRRADAAGVPRDRLRGALDVDPIARLTMRRIKLTDDDRVLSERAAVEPVIGEAIAALRICRSTCPGIRPLVIDGQVFHLAGASPALELGAVLASAIELARRLDARGLDFDALAAGTTLRLQVGHELPLEIAKLRALRLLWAKIGRAFGGGTDALRPCVLGVPSGRFRAEFYDLRTNLVRSMLAAFAGASGGCDAWLAVAHDDSSGARSADLARDQLHLLRAESHAGRVADPFGGSFAIERLTDEIGRHAWDFVQDLERSGGILEAARSGFLGERIRIAEAARERSFRTRQAVVVGISRFADPQLGAAAVADDAQDSDELLARHRAFVAGRDARAAQRVLDAIAAQSAERFFEHALGEDADHATVAELATATWPPEGTVFEHLFLPVAVTDAHEFEDLRANLDDARAAGESVPAVVVLPFGPRRAALARATFARELFVAGGFAVETRELASDLEPAVRALAAAGARIVVLCGADAELTAAADQVAAVLRAAPRSPLVYATGALATAAAAHFDGTLQAGMDAVAFLSDLQADLGLLLDADEPEPAD